MTRGWQVVSVALVAACVVVLLALGVVAWLHFAAFVAGTVLIVLSEQDFFIGEYHTSILGMTNIASQFIYFILLTFCLLRPSARKAGRATIVGFVAIVFTAILPLTALYLVEFRFAVAAVGIAGLLFVVARLRWDEALVTASAERRDGRREGTKGARQSWDSLAKAVWRIGVGVFAALGVFWIVVIGSHIAWLIDDDACAEMEAIADDPAKVAYLREWMRTRFRDPDFVREINDIHAYDDKPDDLEEAIGLDLGYLDIRPSKLGIATLGSEGQSVSDIEAVRIRSGVDAVLVAREDGALDKLKDDDDLVIRGDHSAVRCRPYW